MSEPAKVYMVMEGLSISHTVWSNNLFELMIVERET
jgi:hypothetical protein